MNSTLIKAYQVAGVEDMSTDASVSDRKYRAIFTGNQGMINVRLSSGKILWTKNDGFNIEDYIYLVRMLNLKMKYF